MITQNIAIENARIIFRNFAGEASQFNARGDRNFCVLIDNDAAPALANDGWNIRYLKPKDPDEQPQAYLKVKVNFGQVPPTVLLITAKNKKRLTEDNIDVLDWAELKQVDLIIRPYNWEVNGKSGVKAYLKSGYFTIMEDEFASKYEDLPSGE